MNVSFTPSFARGSAAAPPSKSMGHRALFAAALGSGESFVSPIAPSEDMKATLSALSALGAAFTPEGEGVRVRGMGFPRRVEKTVNCRESGSTLRFVLPLCLLTGEEMLLTGAPRLLARPLSVYEDLCREKGFLFRRTREGILVRGKLTPGEYTVPGNISSQFITGLLFALSLLPGESLLRVTGEMESAPYVDMTLAAMGDFGVFIRKEGQNFIIPGFARFESKTYTVEGDYSNAAFPDAFNLLGGCVSLTGLREDSLQGDALYRRIYPKLKEGFGTFDLSQCPDLAPILFALAAALHGGEFTGTARLREKESDRGAAMKAELEKCGVSITLEENRILVPGGALKAPCAPISGHNDHRIVMAMSVLLSRLGGELHGAEAVTKSYPDFFEMIQNLGIEVKINETE
ncbi:MAG: 3-phosphoshikimate 1-carboxyvinyltransferase [Clostridia bacterium]|nr:3-phosphoshikimate 1-carboxyvinyltransferase [Clostridia bacterium]